MATQRQGSWLGNLLRTCFPNGRSTHLDPPSASSPTNADNAFLMNPIAASAESASGAPLTAPAPIKPPPTVGDDNAALGAVKLALQGLEDGLDLFPPLKPVISGLLECVVHVEVVGRNRQDYESLMQDLARLADLVRRNASESRSTHVPVSITNLGREIEEQVNHIKQRQDRTGTRRAITAMGDQDDVLSHYRRVQALFHQLEIEISLSTRREQQIETRMKDLTPAHSAAYDAGLPTGVVKRTGCTPKTRVEVLAQTRAWYQDENESPIYWMNGMAGTGKTTIAYSLCEELERDKRLAASFFCSRSSPDCRDISRIIPTIAYQLGQYSNDYRSALGEALNDNPNLATKAVNVQFKKLVVEPLTAVKYAIPDRLVVVIDALDECSDINGTKTILDMLLQNTSDIPIKLFITSRPEPSISNKMASPNGAKRSVLRLHDIGQSIVQEDIKTYLWAALESITSSTGVINLLAERSGRLFIFAATAVRYIIPDEDGVDPQERLQTVLDTRHTEGDTRYQELDGLYKTIVSKALGGNNLNMKETKRRRCILWTVICAREPLNPAALSELLDVGAEQPVRSAIQSLQSVLYISASTGVVSTFHASFPDFLLSRERSQEYCCEALAHHSYLATRCFDYMERSLKFNICNLETSFRLDREVSDLESRVIGVISPALFYVCRYWSDHLSGATLTAELMASLGRFLKRRLLFWMEVLSLKKCSNYGEAILSQVVNQLSKNDECAELRDFAHDARNFATTFAANPCSLSTPHIYTSVLPFTSRESQVWKTYWPRMKGLIEVEGAAMDARGQSALATWAVGNGVNSVALSSDGKRVVSGSGWRWGSDGKIPIWNTSSGAPILELPNGHGKRVTSVAFSPDHIRIASGSDDRTICIWDATKGKRIAGPLQGHTAEVTSVAFSTDGAILVSGSDDSTTRMWDAYSGAPLGQPLNHHQGGVASVAFSPNGKHLASGSSDHAVRVWDFRAGSLAYKPIDGHTGAVRSIAYSRDGLRLVSGSSNGTVRVWHTGDGDLFAGPFEGHADAVRSVSFSPDGTRIVSGSDDRTIRVWETVSGRLLAGPFEGHSDSISSVLFTADGIRILSGSLDGTIRVWDSRQGSKGPTKSLGHSGDINSVVWSPDGTRAASGSSDKTICVWDTCNGALIAGPFAGHTELVLSVAFSPDGARIVSGSDDHTLRTWDARQIPSGSEDRTIRLWDSHTGASVTKPFEGHTEKVTSITFSPNGARIVSGSHDGTTRMWDASNGTTLWASRARTGLAFCVAISPDGTRIVSGSIGTISVFDAESGTVVAAPLRSHTGWVNSVAFSPDGTRVVSGADERTLRVWDVESGATVASPLNGHADSVRSVAFSPDGVRIISGSADHTIRIWDVATIAQASSASRDRWSIDKNGWLTNSNSQRLFWVPPDLRRGFGFLTPSNPIVINADCTTRVGDATLLGDRWHRCYNASLDSVSD